MIETRPVWAEINLDNLAHNIREVRRVTAKNTKIMAVIKADGYGHGASPIGQTLLENGADCFAVATLSEAIRLRLDYPTTPILILGYTPNEMAPDVAKYQLTQTIYNVEQATYYNDYAAANNTVIKVHLKIDTGMSRLGFMWNDQSDRVVRCFDLKNLDVEGVYTHFARADEIDKAFTKLQVSRYLNVVERIENAGFKIAIKHVSNSAAIIDLPQYNFDMVRAGIMLYGLYPSSDVDVSKVKLREVMALRARVANVKTLPSGIGISYGHKYSTDSEQIIATLPLGYADGFTRMLSGKGDVLYNGARLPIVGRICMDQCMIMANKDIKIGDIVTLFGKDHHHFKSIDEVANALHTINYEIVCMIGKRIPRSYLSGGQVLAWHDDVLRLKKGGYCEA